MKVCCKTLAFKKAKLLCSSRSMTDLSSVIIDNRLKNKWQKGATLGKQSLRHRATNSNLAVLDMFVKTMAYIGITIDWKFEV